MQKPFGREEHDTGKDGALPLVGAGHIKILAAQRFERMMRLVRLPEGKLRVLEVGCGEGKDVLQFMAGDSRYELWAVDILPQELRWEDVHFVQADAARLPFEDGSFDLVITVGVLEHIEPVEKLCAVIRELGRVGRHQLTVVPSVSTLIEPHCGALRWALRLHRDKLGAQEDGTLRLNYLSDHTWSKFGGFAGCSVEKTWYLPPLISNTIIFR